MKGIWQGNVSNCRRGQCLADGEGDNMAVLGGAQQLALQWQTSSMVTSAGAEVGRSTSRCAQV